MSSDNYLISSDWHLGHHNIRFLCDRPWDWPLRLQLNHRRAFEENPGAELIHLGDVLFARHWKHDLREIWPGSAIVTLGNHDRQKEQKLIREAGWLLVDRHLDICGDRPTLEFCHRPQDLRRENLRTIGIYGHKHNAPLTQWESSETSIRISPEFMDYRPIPLNDLLKLGETPIWHAASQRWYGASTYPEKLPVKETGPNHRE